jgi:hypothetical protein
MTEAYPEPAMVAVWVAMAHHFLDTETRHDLPLTALCCVEAGLSAAQAREVWRFEVAPAVGANLYSMVGEWAYWDRDWLVERILRLRGSWWNRPGPGRKFHFPLFLSRGDCLAVERCIALLHPIREPSARERLTRDLVALSRVMVDMPTMGEPIFNAQDRERLSQLYPAPFSAVMRPALLSSEVTLAERRIEHALFG